MIRQFLLQILLQITRNILPRGLQLQNGVWQREPFEHGHSVALAGTDLQDEATGAAGGEEAQHGGVCEANPSDLERLEEELRNERKRRKAKEQMLSVRNGPCGLADIDVYVSFTYVSIFSLRVLPLSRLPLSLIVTPLTSVIFSLSSLRAQGDSATRTGAPTASPERSREVEKVCSRRADILSQSTTCGVERGEAKSQ